MQINESDYNIKVEHCFNGTVKYVCTPKERQCDNDGCNKLTRYDKLTLVKFSTVNDKQRYIVDAMICNSCYPQVKEWINNNPNRRRM